MNTQRHDAQLKRVVDAVPRLDMFRGDAQGGIFAQHLVRATFRELFRFEYPATKWINGGLIPMNTSLNEGSKEYSYLEKSNNGLAEIVADNATDLPMAEIDGELTVLPIKTIGISVTYSRQDVRTARMQGFFDIAAEKASAAREGNDRRLDQLIRTGDAASGLRGVVNHPGIIVATAGTGNWLTATSAQIIDDVTTAINAIANASDAVEMPNTVLMPVAQWNRLSTLPFDSASGPLTVLDYLRSAFPMITRWDWEPGLKDVSASGGPSMLVYRNSPSHLRAVFPMMMAAVPPQDKGLSFVLNFETRFGGVMMPRPRSVLRLDGI